MSILYDKFDNVGRLSLACNEVMFLAHHIDLPQLSEESRSSQRQYENSFLILLYFFGA